MKKLEAFFARHKRLAAGLIFLCCAFFGGCIFPVYNLTRMQSNDSPWHHLYLAASVFVLWGYMANLIFPKAKPLSIAGLNLGLTLGGMLFRFLLEFGEVSNTYNFTFPNMAIHIFAAVGISTLSWFCSKKGLRK